MYLNEVTSRLARRRAFTLIELLVVIAIIAILASILLPVLHQAQLRGETAACIDHQKQLAAAWLMYSQDNNDGCAGNNWTGTGGEEGWWYYRGKFSLTASLTQPTNWCSGWMNPVGDSADASNSNPKGADSDNTNDDLLIDPSYASLGDYIKNRQIFLCPACEVKVDAVVNSNQKIYNQVRSVSMNCWVGYICNQNGQTVGGPTGSKVFTRTTTIFGGINPADLFVFMEERGESIDDGSFLTEALTSGSSTTIANFPTDYHNEASTVGFADGHVDVHRWFGEPIQSHPDWGCTARQDTDVSAKWNFGVVNGTTGPHMADLRWMQTHATCSSQ